MNEEQTTAVEEKISAALVITVIQDVLRRWYLVLVVTLVAAMGAFVLTDAAYRPVYKTYTTFVVTAGGTSTTTYQNLSATNELAATFSEVLNSSLLRKEILKESGLDTFKGIIDTSVYNDTNLLEMTVTGSDPRTVFLITKAIIKHHRVVTDQVLNGTVLEVLKAPAVPVRPINSPGTKRRVMQAAVLAAGGMCVLLGGLSYLADKIRSKTEADSKLRCHVLGELFHERKHRKLMDILKRKKTSILITNPTTSFAYTESINKLSSRVMKRMHAEEKILMVTSYLENEGKSTVAINLALSMARKGRKVLLIDSDLRKPACSLALGCDVHSEGIVEVLQSRKSLDSCTVKLEDSGLYLLPSRRSLRTAIDLIGSGAMAVLLLQAASNYDYVIIDTPPMALAPDAECLSEFADAAVLVVRQNEAYAGNLNDAAMLLEKSGMHMLGCILNNVYGAGSFAPAFRYGSYGSYGRYGRYGRYGKYGRYGYGRYGRYGYGYGRYGYGYGKADADKTKTDNGENRTS